MNANRRPAAAEAVNHTWLEWFASQMLTEGDPAAYARPATRIACDHSVTKVAVDIEDEVQPNRRQRRFLSKRAAAAAGIALAAGIVAPTLAAAAPGTTVPQATDRNVLPLGYLPTAGRGPDVLAPIQPQSEVEPARPRLPSPRDAGSQPAPAQPQQRHPSIKQQDATSMPGVDPAYSNQQIDAMRDVIDKAESPGYISLYSPKALRATTLPADVRRSLDRDAVNAQMRQSFMNDQYNRNALNGFRDRFNQNIDDIHNATSVRGQNAAIARFNQTAMEFNGAEMAERDNFGGHPTNARGQTIRTVPKALANPNSAPASNGQTAPNAVPVSNGQQVPANEAQPANAPVANTDVQPLPADQPPAQPTQVQPGEVQAGVLAPLGQFGTQANTIGPQANTPATATPGVNVTLAGDKVQGNVFDASTSGTTQFGGVTATGQADARALGGEASVRGGFNSTNGLNAQAAAQAYLGQVTTQGSLQSGPVELGGSAKATVGADAAANASIGPNGAQLGANAFAGAKAGGEAHADLGGLRAGVSGEVRFGIGAEARGTISRTPDGKITVGADAGLALGPGGKAGFSVTVDPAKAYQTVQDAVNSLNPFGTSSRSQQPQASPTQAPPTNAPATNTSQGQQAQAEQQAPAAEQQAPTDQQQAPTDDQQSAQPDQAQPDQSGDQGASRGLTPDDGSNAGNVDDSLPGSDSLNGSGGSDNLGDSGGSDNLGDSGGSDNLGGSTDPGSGGFSGDLGAGDFTGGGDLGGGGDFTGGGDLGAGDFTGGGGDFGGGGATGDFGGAGGDFGGGGF